MWQASEDWPGSLNQQQAVRDALIPTFGSKFHRLTQRMDRWINRPGYSRHFVPIAFVELPFLAQAFASGILLSTYLTDPTVIRNIVRHEAGHVYDQLDLLTQADKLWFMDQISGHHNGNWRDEYQETWADAFRDWINTDGEQWAKLTPILLGEAA